MGGVMMKVGYARVSTTEQSEERQVSRLKELGAKKIFIDKLSGKNTERPQLNAMLDFVREEDIVIVSEYSRLARSTRDLLDIVQGLHDRGIPVMSDKEHFDTSTPQGNVPRVVSARNEPSGRRSRYCSVLIFPAASRFPAKSFTLMTLLRFTLQRFQPTAAAKTRATTIR